MSFTVPDQGGLRSLGCVPFIDSITRTPAFALNREVKAKCDGCEEEDATVHCLECGENMGLKCLIPHKRMKATSSHQQILLDEILAGATATKRIPRCQTHQGAEISTYCQTCNKELCLRCLTDNHSGYTFCSLSQMGSSLRDQVAGFTLIITRKGQEAERAVVSVGGTLGLIEESRAEIAAVFASLHKALDVRQEGLIAQVNQRKETVLEEKEVMETVMARFKDFRTFAEGLLAQGTPHELVGSLKLVSERVSLVVMVVMLIFFIFISVLRSTPGVGPLRSLIFPARRQIPPTLSFPQAMSKKRGGLFPPWGRLPHNRREL